MNLSEYATYDATGIAALINSGQVSAEEIRGCALRAIDAVNGDLNAVIETYDDPVPAPPDTASHAPFAGVPYLIKDVGLHFGGLKCEFCSRLCEGMTAAEDSHYAGLVRRSGISIVGRTNTPEFSMSGTSENILYGNTSTPWKLGYSSNGSSGGSAAAVSAGIVPMAHGSDIGGSIRGPAAWCGGVVGDVSGDASGNDFNGMVAQAVFSMMAVGIHHHNKDQEGGFSTLAAGLTSYAAFSASGSLLNPATAIGLGDHVGKLFGQRLVPRLVFRLLPLFAPGNRQRRVMVVAAVDHDLLLGDAGLFDNRIDQPVVELKVKSQQIVRDDRKFGFSVAEHQGANIKRVVLTVALLHRSDQKRAFGRDVRHCFCRSGRPDWFGFFLLGGLRLGKRNSGGTGTCHLSEDTTIEFGFFHREPF